MSRLDGTMNFLWLMAAAVPMLLIIPLALIGRWCSRRADRAEHFWHWDRYQAAAQFFWISAAVMAGLAALLIGLAMCA